MTICRKVVQPLHMAAARLLNVHNLHLPPACPQSPQYLSNPVVQVTDVKNPVVQVTDASNPVVQLTDANNLYKSQQIQLSHLTTHPRQV